MTFTLGVRELAAWAGADNDVTASSRRLFLQSIRRPKWEDTLPALWNQLAGVHAEVRARGNQEPLLSGLVGDEEAAGGCNADVHRR
jgi:hypothetical protein